MTNRRQKRKYRIKKAKAKKRKNLKKYRRRRKKLCFDCNKNPRDEYGSHCLTCHEKEIKNYKHCEVCEEPWRNC